MAAIDANLDLSDGASETENANYSSEGEVPTVGGIIYQIQPDHSGDPRVPVAQRTQRTQLLGTSNISLTSYIVCEVAWKLKLRKERNPRQDCYKLWIFCRATCSISLMELTLS